MNYSANPRNGIADSYSSSKKGKPGYANKRNTLTPTQMRKRKRLMKHTRKVSNHAYLVSLSTRRETVSTREGIYGTQLSNLQNPLERNGETAHCATCDKDFTVRALCP